jgi:predicted nucleic acid-binding protein
MARRLLDPLDLVTLGGREVALAAADGYRLLRRRGITVRKTIDMIIAAWCIRNNVPLLHSDRDFDVIERELGLVVWPGR